MAIVSFASASGCSRGFEMTCEPRRKMVLARYATATFLESMKRRSSGRSQAQRITFGWRSGWFAGDGSCLEKRNAITNNEAVERSVRTNSRLGGRRLISELFVKFNPAVLNS